MYKYIYVILNDYSWSRQERMCAVPDEYTYLNDFLSKNHISLARKVSRINCITMANFEDNKALLEGQHGIDIPSITAEQLKVHLPNTKYRW